jgi:1,4-alpha-glucan branching enzyme
MKRPFTQLPAWREWVAQPLFHARRLLGRIAPDAQPGMGAIPTATGVAFRVWAPHAQHVFVTGDFNHWSRWQHPLAAEGNGYWSTQVAQAQPGDQYKYMIHHGRQVLLRTDPYARAVTGPHRNGVICTGLAAASGETSADDTAAGEATRFVPAARNEWVIYELHIGTFATPPEGGVGDFRRAIAKLPYLKWLGVNAVEVMPVMEFAGDYSWGYNPGYPFAVTETYGGREGFRAFVEAAHAHGMAVLVDVVYNHFGPDDLGLWQFDGWHQNNLGGIYFYNDWRAMTPWGHTRPDYGRGEVRQYLRDHALMWLEELSADGLRWDATAWIRNVHGHEGDTGSDIPDGWSLMQWINQEVAARRPQALRIAEDMRENEWLTKPPAEGGAGFDAQWDAQFVHTVRHAILQPRDEARDLSAIAAALGHRYANDAFARVIYSESHDEVANGKARVPEEIAPGAAGSYFAKKRSTLGAALVLTAPGIPMLFQGQELLEDGWFDDHHPLDWSRHERYRGILRLYRELIHLRRNLGNCTRGLQGPHLNLYHCNQAAGVLVYHRWDQGGPGDDVVIVTNFANRSHAGYTIGLPRPGVWRVRLNSDAPQYDPGFGDHLCPDVVAAGVVGGAAVDGMPCFGNIVIGPYSFLILSQE